MDAFESCMMDILGDAPIYMENAAKEVAKVCPDCEGSGETQLPKNDRGMAKQMLSAFARDMGGFSTIPVAGDPCRRCEAAGRIYDDDEILMHAAMAAAKDWRDELRVVLAQTLEARDMAINTAKRDSR